MSNTPTDPTNNETQLYRRTFMSAGVIGGMALALSPMARAATGEAIEAESAALTPSPADSINLYILLLDRLRGQILRPYFDLVGCLSAEVKSRYDQLKEDVNELERLVPQLRTRQASNLRGMTDLGQTSAALLGSLAEERVVPATPLFAMISFTPETVRDLANELEAETGSLTLSRRAANLLRKILQQIRDLQKPTEDLNTTSGLLTEINNSLETAAPAASPKTNKPATVGDIRFELIAAMGDLIADQLAGESTAARRESAKGHVESAVRMLTTWDAYKPPDALQTYLATSQSPRCKPSTGTMAAQPTKNLRDLLTATARWIEQGSPITGKWNRRSNEVQFLNASAHVTPMPGLKGNCRSALSEFLPPATGLRTYILMSLIGPIVWFYSAQQCENLIYDQIPNLWPGGAFDNDSARRRAAAKKLAGS